MWPKVNTLCYIHDNYFPLQQSFLLICWWISGLVDDVFGPCLRCLANTTNSWRVSNKALKVSKISCGDLFKNFSGTNNLKLWSVENHHTKSTITAYIYYSLMMLLCIIDSDVTVHILATSPQFVITNKKVNFPFLYFSHTIMANSFHFKS